MFIYSSSGGSRSGNPLSNIGCLIFGVLGLIALFYVLKGLFIVLWWASPVLFALSLIINWRVAANTGTGMIQLLKRNPLAGLVTIALAVVGFPILSLYLFLGAIGNRQIEKMRSQFEIPQQQTTEEEFIEYEEIESKQKNQE
ncbi:MAG: hypothetical protein IPL65_01710 [Lewinellaceae bacterium]|nr:hypothetical protein [Lewinellaceae bacterium]